MLQFKDQWLVKPLIESNLVTMDIIKSLKIDGQKSFYLSDKLISLGYLSEENLGKIIENTFHIPFINLDKVKINKNAIKAVPEEICRKHILIPYNMDEEYISIAISDPLNLNAENEVSYLSSRMVNTRICSKFQIVEKINEHYNPDRYIEDLSERISASDENDEDDKNYQEEKLETNQSDAPIVRLMNSILNDAIDKEASDIHIEPTEKRVLIRFRVDGILKNIMDVPKYAAPQLISRIKVISNLDIAETRKPQDGQAKVKRRNASIDLRVSILPTSYGEKAVIRILDSRKSSIPLDKLGILGDNLYNLNRILDLKQGIVLATGPTGSGKTTTLYAALNKIKSPKMNILTVEDPIEYTIEGINQVQVNQKAGITFASALRSFLRQDPDVILVGEIRDLETAEISIQASLTGHLVLSTIHTNGALETVTRLIDLGVDRYKVTSALSAVIGQRLVRKICSSCREEIAPTESDEKLVSLFKKHDLPLKLYQGKGCPSCEFTGYRGRTGLYEVLILDKDLKERIEQGDSMIEVERLAIQKGFKNFSRIALDLLSSGITDLSEVTRIISFNLDEKESLDHSNTPFKSKTTQNIVRENIEPLSPTADTTSTEGKKILVVDDDKFTRTMITSFLKKENIYDVIEASNGEEALSMIADNKPDLILLDVMMPGLDGYGVCQWVRSNEKFSTLPIIMLTALDGRENLLKGFSLGVDDYISKPVDRHILSARINALLRRVE